MAKYSNLDLLDQELTQPLPGRRDFLGRIIYKMDRSSTKVLSMNIPMGVFLRAQIFCEDIEHLSEKVFTQADLIDLLYMDFLTYAMKNPNPQALYNMLVALERDSGKDLGIIKSEGRSVYQVIHSDNRENMEQLTIRFKRKVILRGEMLLSDLAGVFPDHGFMVENVLEYLYCDFINKFRKGDNSEAIKTILRMLDEDK